MQTPESVLSFPTPTPPPLLASASLMGLLKRQGPRIHRAPAKAGPSPFVTTAEILCAAQPGVLTLCPGSVSPSADCGPSCILE